jgi:oxygen-independent coproporphyrinogen-3 oxidase
MNRFQAALLDEIERTADAPWSESILLRSVFIGGGTPSLATPGEMLAILSRLRRRFAVESAAEVTVECNPESTSLDRLVGYRQAGVNRISLGVQSLDDRILPTLDRLHSATQARRAFDAARAAGFDNVSVDLIYGLPGLDLTTWESTVRQVLEWNPDHLSAYALTLDEGSLWQATGVKGLPSEETVALQYQRLAQLAAEAGYEHYEISNYARPGRRSVHNQIYWRAEEYLACGPGACGFVGDVRYANARALPRYCGGPEGGRLPIEASERLTVRQQLAERLILGLRMADGIPRAWLDERVEDDDALVRRVRDWQDAGMLAIDATTARLTETGFLVSDALFVELL